MLNWLVQQRKSLSRFDESTKSVLTVTKSPAIIQLGYFCIWKLASTAVSVLQFVVEIPIHLIAYPTASFELLARRDARYGFLDSYTAYLRRYRLAIATTLGLFLLVVAQIGFFGYNLYQVGKPTQVVAQSGSVDINPSWDAQGIRDQLWTTFNPCAVDTTTYTAPADTSVTMNYGQDVNDPTDCSVIFDYHTQESGVGMQFSLASIPDNATITGVTLHVYVYDQSSQAVVINGATSDSLSSLSRTSSAFLNAIESGTLYGTDTWSTTGAKSVTLGSAARTAVQSRITGSDILPVGIYTVSSSGNNGGVYSVDNATPSNRPYLTVTYTIPPTAPTGFTSTSVTTSTIGWQWTDNSSSETQYDVHDASHNPVAGCTALAANTTTCTETGLSANTQYTRHANVTDADGNTDSGDASAYTAIETPTGIGVQSTTETSIAVNASGTLSNLTSGSPGFRKRCVASSFAG